MDHTGQRVDLGPQIDHLHRYQNFGGTTRQRGFGQRGFGQLASFTKL